jgi:alpha-tubulin suppressor-like RCC1 family protein
VAAIKTNGQLWVWGRGGVNGGLGDGTSLTRCSPVREFCSATDWCQVSVGQLFTTAIKTSGQLWTWGANSGGTLGIGLSLAQGRCTPVREFCSATDWCFVSAGCTSVAAIKTSGEMWVWGCNSSSLLGDGTTISRCSPVREFTSANSWNKVCVCSNTNGILVR